MTALRTPGIVIAALASLASLLVVAVAIVATHLDSAWVKDELARLVQDNKQRTLRIDGELALSVWPNLDLRLERVTLSERNSPQQFAALDSAHVSLQWLPLLSKQLVIDSIELSGLKATLSRDKDGRLNIADLLEPQPEPSTALKVDIAGIHLADGQLDWRDDITGQDVTFDGVALRSGRVGNVADASGRLEVSAMVKSAHAPQIDARLQLAAQYALEIERQRYAANQLEVRIGGRLGGFEGVELGLNAGAIEAQAPHAGQAASGITMTDLTLRAQGAPGDQPYKLTLAAPQLRVGAGQLNADQLTLTLDGKASGPGGTALQARFTAPLAVDLAARTLALERIAGQLDIVAPKSLAKPVRLALRGDLGVDFAHASAAGNLAGEFDDSRFVARLDVERFAPPVVRFVADIDRLDAARYQAPPSAQAAQASKPAPAGAEKTLISALPNLDLHGTLKIDTLLAAGVKARKLRLDIRTIDGELAISPQSAGPGRVR